MGSQPAQKKSRPEPSCLASMRALNELAPADAIDRPTPVQRGAWANNSASHWGYWTDNTPLWNPYPFAKNGCISGDGRHQGRKADKNQTSAGKR
jgi:hypothetical protein